MTRTDLQVIVRDLVVYEGPDETIPATYVEQQVISIDQQIRDIDLWLQDIAKQVSVRTDHAGKTDQTCSALLSDLSKVDQEMAELAQELNEKARQTQGQQGPRFHYQPVEPETTETVKDEACQKLLRSIRQKCHPDKKPSRDLLDLYEQAEEATKIDDSQARLDALTRIYQATLSRNVRRARKRKSLKEAEWKLKQARHRLSAKYQERAQFKNSLGWVMHESSDPQLAELYARYLHQVLVNKQQELQSMKSHQRGTPNGNQ